MLRESGFATVRADGARRLYSVDSAPLHEVDIWLERFDVFWNQRLDALGTELERGKRERREEREDTAGTPCADRQPSQGIQALTMRRLAADLGVEAMSLYYHLPDKEALLDGVAETVMAEIAASVARLDTNGRDENWRTRLREQFLTARHVMLRHPWAPGLLGSRRTIPAAVYAYNDGIVGTLVGAGFSFHLAHRALHAFGSLPIGSAQEIFSPEPAGGSMEVDAAEAELAAMAEALPHLTAMVAAEVHDVDDLTLGWCDTQVEFEFTLDLLLSGLERLRG